MPCPWFLISMRSPRSSAPYSIHSLVDALASVLQPFACRAAKNAECSRRVDLVPQSVIRKVNMTYSAAATTARRVDVEAMTNSRPESRCAIKQGTVAVDEICWMTFRLDPALIFRLGPRPTRGPLRTGALRSNRASSKR